MFKLFLGLFFCPLMIYAEKIQIITRQWQQEDLFCNTVSIRGYGSIGVIFSYQFR